MAGIFSFLSDALGQGKSDKRISAEDLLALVEGKEKVTLIDVRTREEFKGGHIPGSVSIPLDMLASTAVKAGGRVVVYCASGMRSLNGRAALESKGIRDVFDLKGGLRAWTRAGGPVVTR